MGWIKVMKWDGSKQSFRKYGRFNNETSPKKEDIGGKEILFIV